MKMKIKKKRKWRNIKWLVHSLFSLQFKNPKKERQSSTSCYHINNQSNIILLQPEGKSFSL